VNKEAAKLKLLGKNIAKYRKIRGFSQNVLSEKVDVSREHLSKIEVGIACPSVHLMFKIAEILEVSEKDLFDFK